MTQPVLFVSHSAQLYGAERSLLTLVSELRKEGRWEPVVVLPRGGPLRDALSAAGVTTIEIPFSWWTTRRRGLFQRVAYWCLRPARAVKNAFALRRLERVARALRPAAVYTNSLVVHVGALLARSLAIPHIWHAREFVHEDLGADYAWGEERAMQLVTQSHAVVCNSQAVRAKLAPWVQGEKLHVVYNGLLSQLPSAMASGSPQGPWATRVAGAHPPRLVLIASLRKGKGHEDALRALARLLERGVDVQLDIVGAGHAHYRRRLHALARQLGVSARVRWLGFQPRAADLLESAAVSLVCSGAEAFGRVTVESMAAGVPVVATASGGTTEIVANGENGMLYAPGDAAQLAEAIAFLLRSRGDYDRISRAALQHAYERFSVERYVDDISGLLDRVVTVSGGVPSWDVRQRQRQRQR